MTVVLPVGWTNFNSGGSNPTLCDTGEPIVVTSTPQFFDCSDGAIIDVDLEVTGGVPPFIWDTTEGQIEVTGLRTAILHIDLAIDFSGFVMVGDDFKNPCIMPAYVSRAKMLSSPTTPGPCDTTKCEGVFYNCKGEVIGFLALDGFLQCSPSGEAAIADFNPLTDIYDYSQCEPLPSGWPSVCVDRFSMPPQTVNTTCGDTALPTCLSNSIPTEIYEESNPCSVPPIEVFNSPDGIGPTGTIYDNVSIGSICDIRTPNLKSFGCAPCQLLRDEDIIVTATDATGASTAIEIHVNT